MNTLAPADNLQTRFQEIGLPERLMVELQVTDYEVPFDQAVKENRKRFLEQGYILVVDRRAKPSKTYFIAPTQRGKALQSAVKNSFA
jgi:hypothetical protein